MPQHQHLGQVFISHSSVDKPFVRKLDGFLRRSGFDTWLDEKELAVGDSLPEKIASAIESAKAIIVVISEASLQSGWIRFELTRAAQGMIEGKSRLLPVIIDDAPHPPELRGLFYADCRPGRRGGFASIRRALEEEARRAQNVATRIDDPEVLVRSRGIDSLIREVFDGVGFASGQFSATRSFDYDFVTIDGPDGRQTTAVFEVVLAYGYSSRGAEPLDKDDWTDWRQSVDDFGELFGLLVTERVPEPDVTEQLNPEYECVWSEKVEPSLWSSSGFSCYWSTWPHS